MPPSRCSRPTIHEGTPDQKHKSAGSLGERNLWLYLYQARAKHRGRLLPRWCGRRSRTGSRHVAPCLLTRPPGESRTNKPGKRGKKKAEALRGRPGGCCSSASWRWVASIGYGAGPRGDALVRKGGGDWDLCVSSSMTHHRDAASAFVTASVSRHQTQTHKNTILVLTV